MLSSDFVFFEFFFLLKPNLTVNRVGKEILVVSRRYATGTDNRAIAKATTENHINNFAVFNFEVKHDFKRKLPGSNLLGGSDPFADNFDNFNSLFQFHLFHC